ncbi:MULTISPECIES: glycosyltransferase [Campylobacter]|uniref:glycosyltransferase n=1 Tax=Campylobacter TaxID=194 RepID=UPI00027A397A|nr:MULTISPECIES: glycosyltransferase [Campylobacter]EJP74433.1 glycosyltransferase, group 1 family protein [Campylobacter sp. FOBRC14]
MSKKILWCGNSYYGTHLKVGCNYYSELLAKDGNSVFFISPPISPFHEKGVNKIRFEQAKKGVFKAFENYFVYTPYSLLPPIKKLPLAFYFIIKIWIFFTIPNLKNILKKYSFLDVDILVIDNFAFLPLVNLVKYKKLIVRVTDRLDGFGVSKATLKAENELIKLANKVIYTSSALQEYIKNLNGNSLYVPNGVDFYKFQGDFEKPDFFNSIKAPVAVYIGAIERWFDFKLLEFLASKLKDIHFLIIGDVRYEPKNFNKLKYMENITFYGKVDNALVPNFLRYSSVGIIPFRTDMKLIDAISPLKLYEYMAAGLPVVSVKWQELEHINSPAFLASNYNKFASFLQKAISVQDRQIYLEFAKTNGWTSKIKQIIKE